MKTERLARSFELLSAAQNLHDAIANLLVLMIAAVLMVIFLSSRHKVTRGDPIPLIVNGFRE